MRSRTDIYAVRNQTAYEKGKGEIENTDRWWERVRGETTPGRVLLVNPQEQFRWTNKTRHKHLDNSASATFPDYVTVSRSETTLLYHSLSISFLFSLTLYYTISVHSTLLLQCVATFCASCRIIYCLLFVSILPKKYELACEIMFHDKSSL